MSEEEKDAIEKIIEYLQNKNSDDIRISSKYNDLYGYVTMQFTPFGDSDLQILVNLIDKLQKENEELSQSNFHFLKINQKLIEEKPIIKELTEKELNLLEKISKLQEENEELKKQLESRYYHTINTRELEKEINNSWENKIRDKIKKYRENIEIFKGIKRTDYISITECKILGLQELLEEK